MSKFADCPVASRLKQARERAGISQRHLGIAAGIDEASASARMNQYERGKHVPDYHTLTNLAQVLNVPITYFYCASDFDADMLLNLYALRISQRQQVSELLQRINFDAQI